jgi:hypothetical protein
MGSTLDPRGCEYVPNHGREGYRLAEVVVTPSIYKAVALVLERKPR